ncbi:fluoride efflux transporter CrcB [Streptomyces sp. NPDC014646]|uniref:fluoride efflux transporter CrcB n=1 Tax=unclassified Streptomyces TaxID=2593676 RepID=UPI0009A0C595|nr:fluoride efflux transporter CrcB [Streptomyces sp. CB01580]
MLNEPVDPDVDLRVPDGRRKDSRLSRQGPVVAVVAVGGAVGATARYGASLLWPTATGAFPWTTLTVNAVGCAVIGVFMVVITDVWAAHRLVRPFFGTGVLGGFTTFSTYAVDIQRLVDGRETRTGLAYLALTPVIALTAVWLAVALTRRVITWRQP